MFHNDTTDPELARIIGLVNVEGCLRVRGVALCTEASSCDAGLSQSPHAHAAVCIAGHPGADWGSGCSPCGFNEAFGFGVCVT